MTSISLTSEISLPVRVTGIYCEETGKMQVDTLQVVGLGSLTSREILNALPDREENLLIKELLAEREKVEREAKEEREISDIS